MSNLPTPVRSVPDPNRDIERQVYDVGGTKLRSKSATGENKVGYRWNTKTPAGKFLKNHRDLPDHLITNINNSRNFSASVSLHDSFSDDSKPATKLAIEPDQPFKIVQAFDRSGIVNDNNYLQSFLSGEPIKLSNTLPGRTLDTINGIELASFEGSIHAHWLTSPDRELLGEQSGDGLHTFIVEVDRRADYRLILEWYLETVPPATSKKIDPEEVSTYLSETI